jgi:hypothetical protein
MKNKPLIFTVLSVLCFVEPLIKVLYFKALTHFDFMVILANVATRNTVTEVFDFWVVFPLAGALILKLRKWTYYAFMSVLAYIIYSITTYERYTWPYNSDSPFMYHYVVAGLSIAIFGYFLSPRVREPFFDRRLRWWEPHTRYDVHISCKLHTKNLAFPSEILNISKSGAFLLHSHYLQPGQNLELQFRFQDTLFEVPVEVMNQHFSKGKMGFGVQFKFKNLAQHVQMAKLIRLLKASRAQLREEKVAA